MNVGHKPPLLLVNYHYIRERSQYKYPGIHPISLRDLMDQIKLVESKYQFAKPEQVIGFLSGSPTLEKPSVFLTFDDGLIEHWTVVADVLESRNIRAAFFVASRPFLNHEPLTVHKIHWLRATTEPRNYEEEFLQYLPEQMGERHRIPMYRDAAVKTYVYDDEKTACIKYLMNFLLQPGLVDQITTEMIRNRGMAPRTFCEQTYITEEQIKGLISRGHVIGAHGHTHVPFTGLTKDELAEELRTNIAFLKKVTGIDIEWLSYPYGAVPKESRGLCDKHGIKVGVTLERDWNRGGESYDLVRRINTNEVGRFLDKSVY